MKLVGYAALIDRYDLRCPQPWHTSAIVSSKRQILNRKDGVTEHFPTIYDPGEADLDHLQFALKYDGCDLLTLKTYFQTLEPDQLVETLTAHPQMRALRRLWFLYEWLMRKSLAAPDLKTGNYVELLDPDTYVTAPLFRSPRHRILVNTLGLSTYCPVIRRTPSLIAYIGKDFKNRAESLMRSVDATVLARATNYLYLKESQTSWDIERIPPSQERMVRFLMVLRQPLLTEVNKNHIIRAHNAIVDPDFFATNYRIEQVFVGKGQTVDFIAPKPHDVEDLMLALLSGVDHNSESQALIEHDILAMGGGTGRGQVLRQTISIDPILHATLLGFGFVYIHPFGDGNGRTHRYLLQQVLARREYSPSHCPLPISPAILRDHRGYLKTLEISSGRLMPFIDYSQHAQSGTITVKNETVDLYRYPDFTAHAEFMYQKIEESIERDIHCELIYLQTYDRAKAHVQLLHSLSATQEQMLLQQCFCEGRLAPEVRKLHFSLYDESLVEVLVQAVLRIIQECPLPRDLLQAQALSQQRSG